MPSIKRMTHPNLVQQIADKIEAKAGGWIRRKRYGYDRKNPVEARQNWAALLRDLDHQPASRPAMKPVASLRPIERFGAALNVLFAKSGPQTPPQWLQYYKSNPEIMVKRMREQAANANPLPGVIKNLMALNELRAHSKREGVPFQAYF